MAVMSRHYYRNGTQVRSRGALPAVTTRVEVHAGPFTTLRAVMAFIERLSSVPGVRDVRLDRWVAGRAVLVLRHHDRVPLISSLRVLDDEGTLDISVRQPHGIQIEVRPRG
jgi:hypothetical protein